jgi:hypothetical protein
VVNGNKDAHPEAVQAMGLRRGQRVRESAGIVVDGQHELLHVVVTLHVIGRFPDPLDSGEQKPDQDRDDGNDH